MIQGGIMKRVFFSSLIIVFVMVVCMVPVTQAEPINENKVRICHATGEYYIDEDSYGYVGHFIIVSKKACQFFVDRGDLVSSCQSSSWDCPPLAGGLISDFSPGGFCFWDALDTELRPCPE